MAKQNDDIQKQLGQEAAQPKAMFPAKKQPNARDASEYDVRIFSTDDLEFTDEIPPHFREKPELEQEGAQAKAKSPANKQPNARDASEYDVFCFDTKFLEFNDDIPPHFRAETTKEEKCPGSGHSSDSEKSGAGEDRSRFKKK
jgi:hypothetical protein